MANRLSADKSKRVLLIEAGRKDDYHWIHIPVGYLYCIGNPRTDWLLQHRARRRASTAATLRYPRGKTLGGSSSINGMIYMRGQSRDYDAVGAAHGRRRVALAATCCQPSRSTRTIYLGADDDARRRRRMARREAAPALGHPRRLRRGRGSRPACRTPPTSTAADNEGVGYFQVNQKNGWRWNTAKAFLRPDLLRPAQLRDVDRRARDAPARSRRRPTARRRCTGAAGVGRHRDASTAHATREVMLCAGAIGSPQILQLSGVGPADLLRQHGIDVVLDAPGVGANLQDHLQIRAVYKVDGVPTLNVLAASMVGKAKIGLEYALKRSGPMSMAPSQLGAFTRSSPEHAVAQPRSTTCSRCRSMPSASRCTAFRPSPRACATSTPPAGARCASSSKRFEDAPAIAPNYLSTDEDRKVAADSLRVTRRIASQPGAAPSTSPQEWKPGVQYQTDEDLARLAGDIATTIFHPVGTTKMGGDGDPMAVLDSRLRVRGVRGLRVVDAGAMPTITSGNTNSPTLMMAEKAAGWIVEDNR